MNERFFIDSKTLVTIGTKYLTIHNKTCDAQDTITNTGKLIDLELIGLIALKCSFYHGDLKTKDFELSLSKKLLEKYCTKDVQVNIDDILGSIRIGWNIDIDIDIESIIQRTVDNDVCFRLESRTLCIDEIAKSNLITSDKIIDMINYNDYEDNCFNDDDYSIYNRIADECFDCKSSNELKHLDVLSRPEEENNDLEGKNLENDIKILNNNEKKEEKNIMKNITIGNGLSKMFGDINFGMDENVVLTISGMGVRIDDKCYCFNGEEITEVSDDMIMFEGAGMIMPSALNKVNEGDLIKYKGEYYYVLGIVKNIIDALGVDGMCKKIMATKNMFGFYYTNKVISFGGNQNDPNNGMGNMMMPLMMMQMMNKDGSDDSSNSPMMMMAMMGMMSNGGAMDFGGMSNGDNMMGMLLPLMMMGDKKGESSSMDNLMPLMFMMMNGGFNMFGGANPARHSEPIKTGVVSYAEPINETDNRIDE